MKDLSTVTTNELISEKAVLTAELNYACSHDIETMIDSRESQIADIESELRRRREMNK